MRTVSIRLCDMERTCIPIGFVGENLYTRVRIDSKVVFDEYPTAIASLTVQDPNGSMYPGFISRDGDVIIWDVTASDLVYGGNGALQLAFFVDDVIAKSYICRTYVSKAMIGPGTIPTPIASWIDAANVVLGEAEEVFEALDNMTVAAETLAAGSTATAEISDVDGHKHIDFGIPKGDQGEQGETGPAGRDGADGFSPTLVVTTITGGHRITITDKVGTQTVDVLDGEKGETGATGNGIASVVLNQDYTLTINYTNGQSMTTTSIRGEKGETGATGQTGATGATPIISIGTVTTGAPGSEASATMDTTDPAHPVLSMSIPEGEPGDATIDDTSTAADRVWSAQKVNELKSAITQSQKKIDKINYDIGSNLFQNAELLYENGYASIDNGKISAKQPSNSFNAYLLPVDGVSTYTFEECRFAFLVASDKETAIGDLLQNVKQIKATSASYICFSVNKSNYPVESYFIYGNTGAVRKPKSISATGNMSSGNAITIINARNNLRKNERITFEGTITSFSAIRIGLTFSSSPADSNEINYFDINGTSISYYSRSSATAVTVQHGLTIANNIQIVWEMTETASCKITIISNGNVYEHEFTDFIRKTTGNPFVISSGSSLTGCKLSWTCVDLDKDVWVFGDSYLAYSNVRWTYYLHQYGYDKNCLLDGFPGEGSVNGKNSFGNLLQFGTPKYAVWCLGMNDGTDSESAPETDWATRRDEFLSYCKLNNVTPVFGTIPTVPGTNPPTTFISHEQKNAWIKASGYRYIDFAKAVGANANGEWYSGMLSSDGVHPTETGARALFAQVLVDLPEIMVDC